MFAEGRIEQKICTIFLKLGGQNPNILHPSPTGIANVCRLIFLKNFHEDFNLSFF